jgi:hypothetical protein
MAAEGDAIALGAWKGRCLQEEERRARDGNAPRALSGKRRVGQADSIQALPSPLTSCLEMPVGLQNTAMHHTGVSWPSSICLQEREGSGRVVFLSVCCARPPGVPEPPAE